MTADLLQLYGVDVGDVELMRARPWSWFLALVEGAMEVRSRLLWDRLGPAAQQDVRKGLAAGGDVTPWS